MPPKTRFPFEVSQAELGNNADSFVDMVFASLQSSFLLLPRGSGFVSYPNFQQAYEVLKRHTGGFAAVEPEKVMAAFREDALALVVLRAILGFTPPEWAYVSANATGVAIPQGLLPYP